MFSIEDYVYSKKRCRKIKCTLQDNPKMKPAIMVGFIRYA